jgi:DNA-binding NarL/FixJ family response regulator
LQVAPAQCSNLECELREGSVNHSRDGRGGFPFLPPIRLLKIGAKTRSAVICEVSDGLEAVQKAEELKPDLILLDIGLPTLNGIEAARRIRKLVPESKIIFSTQETDADIVQEAMRLGAWAYVFKTHAECDLLPAIHAVLSGKRFVSSA